MSSPLGRLLLRQVQLPGVDPVPGGHVEAEQVGGVAVLVLVAAALALLLAAAAAVLALILLLGLGLLLLVIVPPPAGRVGDGDEPIGSGGGFSRLARVDGGGGDEEVVAVVPALALSGVVPGATLEVLAGKVLGGLMLADVATNIVLDLGNKGKS